MTVRRKSYLEIYIVPDFEYGAGHPVQLPAFKNTYHLNDKITSNVVSLVNLGAGFGALLSFLLNDRVGRILSLRIYQLVYIAGSLISCLSYGHIAALHVGRVVASLGIGAFSVVSLMAISELAPKTMRGLMTMRFSVCMLSGQVLGIFTVYGCSMCPEAEAYNTRFRGSCRRSFLLSAVQCRFSQSNLLVGCFCRTDARRP